MDFVKFANRDWGYRGDKGTWAAIDTDKNEFVVQRAARGIISDDYNAEIADWCAERGINWDAIPCGGRIRSEIKK